MVDRQVLKQEHAKTILAIHGTLSVRNNCVKNKEQQEQYTKTSQEYYKNKQEKVIRETISNELKQWREQNDIDTVKENCRNTQQDKYSVAVMASGGMLDTIAAIQSGLSPIWGCETDERMQEMWTDMTRTVNYGDAFKINHHAVRRPKVIKTGFPCQDYTELGKNEGKETERGKLYVKQAEIIKAINPDVAIIEQTNGILQPRHRGAIEELLKALGEQYYTHKEEIAVWKHGDASHRKRFYVVAFNKRTMPNGKQFEFPEGKYNERWYHIARDIAQPDQEVPQEYILTGEEPKEIYKQVTTAPGCIEQIGKYGEEAGNSEWPHPLHGWGGLMSTQLTSNGGSRRVMLDWERGQPIHRTRLTTPIETLRAASLDETYGEWIKQFDSSHTFLRLCVNQGVPLRTGMAIDHAVIKKLKQAGIKPDVIGYSQDEVDDIRASRIDRKEIRSMLLDTGANGSLNYKELETALHKALPSKYTIAVADKSSTMPGSLDGQLSLNVINTTHQKGIPQQTQLVINTTTVESLRTELLSFDELYKRGWDLHLQQDGNNYMQMSRGDAQEGQRIPLRRNHEKQGGWWLDYTIERGSEYDKDTENHTYNNGDYSHRAMNGDTTISDDIEDMQMLRSHTYDITSAKDTYNTITQSPQVDTVQIANDKGTQMMTTRDFRGVKAGLKHNKQKMTAREFHEKHGHIGHCDNCEICKMAKGSMRRITKKVDPYKVDLRAHTFTMDMITLSHRSFEGNKYVLQMRDVMSGCIYAIPLYVKSQAPEAIKTWIIRNRRKSEFTNMGYQFCEIIKTDEPGEWSRRSHRWNAIKDTIPNFDMHYVDVSTHKEAGHAERTNRTIEETMKAIMLQQNLPEDHWEAALREAVFLLNRFPSTSTAATALAGITDGDRPRPLEIITGHRYSRRQIDRELSYFVSIGTPALVHIPQARGSSLKPKVRWGVAMGMVREHPVWMCPFTRALFRSKSFTAFSLTGGMNYAQFLGMKERPSIKRSVQAPQDVNETITVQLKPAEEIMRDPQSPVMRLYAGSPKGISKVNNGKNRTGSE